MISDCKIKMKNDEAFNETFNKILVKSHMISVNHSNKTAVDQNLIFSTSNMIITEKTISVTDVIF